MNGDPELTPPPVDLTVRMERPGVAGDDDALVIEPVAYEPGEVAAPKRRGLPRVLVFGLITVLALLGAAVWFMFAARPVLFDYQPAPERLVVTDTLLKFRIADRWLLLPGEHSVTATREGYYPRQDTVTVTSASNQEFEFAFEPLPGVLRISSSPAEPAEVLVDGESMGTLPIEPLELTAGDHTIELRMDRYAPFSTTVTMEGREIEQTLVGVLEPRWADVSLTSEPDGATLYVEDEPVGETPLTAEIIEGLRAVELRKPGYKSWFQELRVRAGQPLELPQVTLTKADGLVSIRSQPSGANVTIDGSYRGQTPLDVTLRPDRRYRVALNKAGYREATREITVDAAGGDAVSFALRAVLGEVLVRVTPSDAEVFVDGVSRGSGDQRLRLTAVPHRVEVRKPGFARYSTTVTPNPDLEQAVDAVLMTPEQARYASLRDVISVSGYAMKLIRPGRFEMGSPRGEQGRRSNEVVYEVELTRPYYFGTTEVTNELYKQFRAEHDSGVEGRFSLDIKSHPVVRVTWADAVKFCNWLSTRDKLPAAYELVSGKWKPVEPMNQGYRLPTEAEWTWAARYAQGQTDTKYPWGQRMPPTAGSGNFAGREVGGLVPLNLSTYQDDYPATAPVGTFTANPLGIHDLGGNVSEWMHDFYTIPRATRGDIVSDPTGPKDGENHVIRGSSWRSASIAELRVAWRDAAAGGSSSVGFRVARYAD